MATIQEAADAASNYEGGNEQVRTSIMNAFGYFQTESSHHASEYLPYFRKSPELAREFIPERWDYFEICAAHDDQGDIDAQLTRAEGRARPEPSSTAHRSRTRSSPAPRAWSTATSPTPAP